MTDPRGEFNIVNGRFEGEEMRNWTPEEYWEFVGGLTGDFERDQMRSMLAERGLSIVPKTARNGLAAELMAFHDACSMDAAGGDGQFRILCSSGSSEQALALRAVLREAAAAVPQTAPSREKIIEIIGYRFGALVSGNNQPHMSGDPRARIIGTRRRHFDDACADCADEILALSRPHRGTPNG